MTFVQKTVKRFEAPLLRVVFFMSAEMPLADQGRGVPGFLQQMGKRSFGQGQTRLGMKIVFTGGIAFVAEPCLVLTGQQTRP